MKDEHLWTPLPFGLCTGPHTFVINHHFFMDTDSNLPIRTWSTDSTAARSYMISHDDSPEHIQAELGESSPSCDADDTMRTFDSSLSGKPRSLTGRARAHEQMRVDEERCPDISLVIEDVAMLSRL